VGQSVSGMSFAPCFWHNGMSGGVLGQWLLDETWLVACQSEAFMGRKRISEEQHMDRWPLLVPIEVEMEDGESRRSYI
jgi:hypothetical protein